MENTMPESVMMAIARRVKDKRLEMDLSQKDFATRADMSLGIYRWFEATGEISFRSLITLADAIGMKGQVSELFSDKKQSK